MNEFDPQIDLIDRYLRGELQGAELEAFMTKLQSDSAFNTRVKQQEKIAAAIYALGHARMKKYLAEKTRHRGIFSITKKTWYFAAASVVLVIFATAMLLWKLNPKNQDHTTLVKTDPEVQLPNGPNKGKTDVAVNSAVAPKIDTTNSINGSLAQQTEEIGPPAMEQARDDAQVADADPILVASNIRVVAIQLQPEVSMRLKSLKAEAEEFKQPKLSEAATQSSKTPTASRNKVNSSAEYAESAPKQSDTLKIRKPTVRFSLTFYETPKQTATLEIEKFNDMFFIRCFDIAYGNPLVYEWQGRYFLQTGIKTYELKNLPAQNNQKSAPTAATEVKDPSILNMIGR